MVFAKILLCVVLLLTTASGAYASLSEVTILTLVPAQLSDDMKVLEKVAGNWSPEWRHELPKGEAVLLAERTIRNIDDLLSTQQGSTGELLLLKGLAAHYAYNLDIGKDYDLAVESFKKARKALPGDCRPLWFLGNHCTKAGDVEKGVPLLKQAEHQCGDNLPLSFWEDYAYAAVLAAMPATGQYALDQVKARNTNVVTEKVKAVEEGLKKRLDHPITGKEYEPREIWQFGEQEGTVRLVNSMYGFMMDLPRDWPVSPFGVRKGASGINLSLPKKGKWPPPLQAVLIVSPASPANAPERVLRTFLAKAGTRRTFDSTSGPGVPQGGKFVWLESRQKKGSRVIAGILRRARPAYPGLLLESPHNLPKPEDDSQVPRYYTPVRQLSRLPGDLDYIIMIEGAPAAFDKGRADLELLLRNLVIE